MFLLWSIAALTTDPQVVAQPDGGCCKETPVTNLQFSKPFPLIRFINIINDVDMMEEKLLV